MVIFDPPRRPPRNPQKFPILTILTTFGHFWDSWFLTIFRFENEFRPQKPPKLPFLAKIDPPADPPNPKILENGPFGENRGFQAWFEPQKRGGVGVYPGTPQKGHFWPFLTIFDHFWPFWPLFGHFRPLRRFHPPESPNSAAKCEPENVSESGEFWRFLAKKGRETPPETPLARQTISNNRVIRPQIWNLRRKRGFFCTPTGAGEMWVNLAAIYPLLSENLAI